MSLFSWLVEPYRDTERLALETPVPRAAAGEFGGSIGGIGGTSATFAALEEQRRAALRFRFRCLLVGLPTLMLLGPATYLACQKMGLNTGDAVVWGVMVSVIGVLILRAVAKAGLSIYRKTAKHRVLSALALNHGLTYSVEGVDREALRPFDDQQLFGIDTGSGASEDVFSGRIGDVDFLLFEAIRESARKTQHASSSTVVFDGLCLRVSFPKRFSGTTRVMGDLGALNALHAVGGDQPLERVRLESADFEEHFEVVTTDQVEARYLLTPAFMERLLHARRVLGPGTVLRAGFSGRDLLMTLDTRGNRSLAQRVLAKVGVLFFGPTLLGVKKLNHFEVKDVNKPVEEMAMIRDFEKDIAMCEDIVATLRLNLKTRV